MFSIKEDNVVPSDIVLPELNIKCGMSTELINKLSMMKTQADNDIELLNDLFSDNNAIKKSEVKKSEVKK